MPKRKSKEIPGINIQWPWSQWILNSEKTIETRGYPIPEKHIGRELALIETPGPQGKKNGVDVARIIGVVKFSGSFLYKTRKQWLTDQSKHLVRPRDTTYGYNVAKPKYGWHVESVKMFKDPVPAPYPRGIVFASKCEITELT